MSSPLQRYLHWVPLSDDPAASHALTACGLDIDGPCDGHLAMGVACQHGLAWTRSRDLQSYADRPYEHWPPPCPVCESAAAPGGGGPHEDRHPARHQPRTGHHHHIPPRQMRGPGHDQVGTEVEHAERGDD